MKHVPGFALIAALALTPLVANAQAASTSVEFRTIRLTQDDPPKAAEFYKKVFGLHELQRSESQVVMNLSSTAREMPRFALAKRQPGVVVDAIPHIIFNVMDFEGVMKKVPMNGGVVQTPGRLSGIGNMVGFVRDPGGNVVEVVGPAPGKTTIN